MASTIRGTNNFDSAWGNAQTWTDVTSSRTFGTTYTNSTAAPIMVCISCGRGTGEMLFNVNGVGVQRCSTSAAGSAISTISVMVPAGATYSLTNVQYTPSILSWTELR